MKTSEDPTENTRFWNCFFPLTLALRVQCRADRQPRLLNSIEIATIVSYNEQAKMLINLIQSDIWGPLGDLVFRLRLMRIMPCRTAENVIAGLVITFVDINPAICRLTKHAGTSHPFETLS